MANGKLEPCRLATGELAQPRHELQQFDGRGERRVRRRGMAILAFRHAAGTGDLAGYLGPGQQPPLPRLGALGQLQLDHLHLGFAGVGDKPLLTEAPVRITATEVTGTDLPDQVTTVFAMIG